MWRGRPRPRKYGAGLDPLIFWISAALYKMLNQADAAGLDWIAVDIPPASPEWEAAHDRLRRAASSE